LDVITEPIELFGRAAKGAVAMAEQVGPTQRHAPTPCAEWDVEQLLTHMVGGTSYLMGALGIAAAPTSVDAMSYAAAVDRCVQALQAPGALDGRCQSPAGFEWSVAEAAAGTAMDQLVHTWDLAVAIGADRQLDQDVVDTIVTMFLPAMPAVGRQAGIVGPEVSVPDTASAQDRLLAAMGRQP
jgi:uncharacterized protein (TIGR03086 family)